MGKFGGVLSPLRATEIASQVAMGLFTRLDIDVSTVHQIIGGMVLQDMSESNPARIVGQRVGVSDAVPAFTINMQCVSGMAALIMATRQIALGSVDSVLVVGMESMSNPPYMVHGARWGMRMGNAEFIDTLEECKLAGSAMWSDPWTMIDVAEHHSEVDGVSREEMDEYALISHRRAIAASDAGRFKQELVPITVSEGKGSPVVMEDENPRRSISIEQLERLRPIREGGTVTAGNASANTDGAAVALICNDRFLAEARLDPLARINVPSTAMVGCDPHLMGYSCVLAAQAALDGAQTTLDKVDLIECNEGFAVQMVACQRMAEWPKDRLNVDGGGISLGHPVGMSGLRIVIHLAKSLQQRDERLGLATVPAGSGLGAALLLDRV